MGHTTGQWKIVQVAVGGCRQQVFAHRPTREEAEAYAARLNRTFDATGTLRYEVRTPEGLTPA